MNITLKTSLISCALLLAAAGSLTGCCNAVEGNGTIQSEERPVTPFTVLDVDDGISVDIETGHDEPLDTLFVETDENILPWLSTSIHGDALVVFARDQTRLYPSKGAYVAAQTTRLDDVFANNGSYVEVHGEGNEVDIDANNGATVDAGDLEVKWAFVEANNGAQVVVCATHRVRGRARNGGEVVVRCGGADDVSRD